MGGRRPSRLALRRKQFPILNAVRFEAQLHLVGTLTQLEALKRAETLILIVAGGGGIQHAPIHLRLGRDVSQLHAKLNRPFREVPEHHIVGSIKIIVGEKSMNLWIARTKGEAQPFEA